VRRLKTALEVLYYDLIVWNVQFFPYLLVPIKFNNKNLAIANRSRVSCAQYIESIYRPKYYPVTLKSRLRVTQGQNGTIGQIIHDLLLVELFDVE